MKRLNTHPCPSCGKANDATTCVALKGEATGPEPTPTAGDIGMCFGCGAVLVYELRLGILACRLMRAEEQAQLTAKERKLIGTMALAQASIPGRTQGHG